MTKLQSLLAESAKRHNRLCPRQVLGVHMGLLAGKILASGNTRPGGVQ
ncbi:MAG TPA: hypothetical protein VLM80_12290 [Anaerolineales bacterium]|nr:hypothetical protein [Anaerolineales bacterium]